jgi:hypothetical protein
MALRTALRVSDGRAVASVFSRVFSETRTASPGAASHCSLARVPKGIDAPG